MIQYILWTWTVIGAIGAILALANTTWGMSKFKSKTHEVFFYISCGPGSWILFLCIKVCSFCKKSFLNKL